MLSLDCKHKEREPQLDSGLLHKNTNCGLLASAGISKHCKTPPRVHHEEAPTKIVLIKTDPHHYKINHMTHTHTLHTHYTHTLHNIHTYTAQYTHTVYTTHIHTHTHSHTHIHTYTHTHILHTYTLHHIMHTTSH